MIKFYSESWCEKMFDIDYSYILREQNYKRGINSRTNRVMNNSIIVLYFIIILNIFLISLVMKTKWEVNTKRYADLFIHSISFISIQNSAYLFLDHCFIFVRQIFFYLCLASRWNIYLISLLFTQFVYRQIFRIYCFHNSFVPTLLLCTPILLLFNPREEFAPCV